MKKNKKIILQDYTTVAELIKFADKNKKKIKVNRKGNDFVGIYWEVILS